MSPPSPQPDLPTDPTELEDRILAGAAEFNSLMGGGPPMEQPAPELGEEMPMEGGFEASEPTAPMALADPALVEEATQKMVEAGMLERITGQITPEVERILRDTADAAIPEMLDLSNEQDLEQLLQGVANGTIPLPDPGADLQPAPGGLDLGGLGAAPGAGEPAPGDSLGGGGLPGRGFPGPLGV